MAIITISRGSYSMGKEVAEKVAQRLGYECLARELLLEASEQFNVPEVKLLEAIKDAPSFLDRLAHHKEKYVATVQATLLKYVKKDNIVYHGFAGHFFLKEVPHVLKVRILADMEDRVRILMARDGKSRKEAARILKRIDEQRTRWGKTLYGIDTGDPSLYDLVLNIRHLRVDSAVEVICHTVELPEFRTTEKSQGTIDDLCLASEVRIALANLGAEMEVVSRSGVVSVITKAPKSQEGTLAKEIEGIARQVHGVKGLEVEVIPVTLFE